MGFPLPSITGFTSVQANLPATVENSGWELELSAYIFQKNDFYWETSFNITFPKNELVNYPGIEQSSYAQIYRVGHPLNISLLYEYNGFDPETGFYSIKDINQDGRYNYEDRIVIHHNGKELFGGLYNSFNFKNFSLQFLLQFVKQEGSLHLFNAGELRVQRAVVVEALEDNSRFQPISVSPQASIAYTRVLNTTFPIVDASFLRLKTLSLGYSIPAPVLKMIGLKAGKIFLHGQNLFTITGYEGMDPERPQVGTSFAGLRTITGGLQLKI